MCPSAGISIEINGSRSSSDLLSVVIYRRREMIDPAVSLNMSEENLGRVNFVEENSSET